MAIRRHLLLTSTPNPNRKRPPGAKLTELLEAGGLTHFNVSLDTLKPERFARISRRPAKLLQTVLGTIDRLLDAG